MSALRFVIGALEIDPLNIAYTGDDVYHEAAHKFVVERRGDAAAIYACVGRGHQAVAEHFRDQLHASNLVGGGSVYIDADGVLVVGSYSGTYGFLPKEVCEAFAKLVMKHCKEKGMKVIAARGDPQIRSFLDDCWSQAD